MRRATGRNRQRGANLLEAALTMLIFFTVIFAIIDFGRALNVYHTLTDAAREGARYSVAPFAGTATLPSSSEVTTFVQNYLNAANVNGATIAVDQSYPEVVNGNTVYCTQVNVSVPYEFIIFPFSVTLNTSSVMRNETN